VGFHGTTLDHGITVVMRSDPPTGAAGTEEFSETRRNILLSRTQIAAAELQYSGAGPSSGVCA
jgi:hypothetical protein